MKIAFIGLGAIPSWIHLERPYSCMEPSLSGASERY